MNYFRYFSIFIVLILIFSSCGDSSTSTTTKDLFDKKEVVASQCQDGKDNDGDGKIDCDDEDCKGFIFCKEEKKTEDTAVFCNDGEDNDGDGKVDCDDEECQGFTFCSSKVENTAVLCQDTLDSDGDGKIDCEDEDCQGFTFCATTQENTAIVCQDNRDNDGDGKVDCDDEECQGFTFCETKVENTAALCNDGNDNDEDGKVDCEDEDCQVFTFCMAGEENTSTACKDNNDNDGDGKVDCEDDDCQGFTFCQSEPKVENTAVLCQDGEDNDNDLATDCDDIDCQGFTFCQPLLENTAVKCQDGEDNDGDNKIDCDDEDCQGFVFCVEDIPVENTALLCQDGEDNDGDNKIDCDDEDCQGFVFCVEDIPVENTALLCQDGEDNDSDGKVDCDDEDCQGFVFCVEDVPVENTAVLCQDGEDNDGDNKIDCDDEDCQGFVFCVAPVENSATLCQDGEDNDSDGKVDCDDEDCQGFVFCSTSNTEDTSVRCQDGEDNDGDGKVDCDDEDCWQFSFCNVYNGDPVTDAWGATWDSIERGQKTWAEAKAICESLGGRLPTVTELYRNNATSGTGDIAQTYNTNYLWTLITEYHGQKVIVRLNDGANSYDSQSDGSKRNFRCIWPNESSNEFAGNKCYGPAGSECRTYDRYYNLDKYDRPPLDYVAATNECNFYAASIPTLVQWSEAIHQGLENGENHWNWVADSIYWYRYGNGSSLVRWQGNGDPSWRFQYSNMGTLAYHTSKEWFRCIGLKSKKDFTAPQTNNCNGADGCFKNNNRGVKLTADSEDRTQTTFASAVEICRNLGGSLAEPKDFVENIHQGWKNGSNSWLWVFDLMYWYSGGYGGNVLRWNGDGNENWYYNWSNTFSYSSIHNGSRPYRCTWTQKRPDLPSCSNDTDILVWNGSAFECKAGGNGSSNGNANGFEKIDPWGNAWDGVARSGTFEDAQTTCESLGGRLPTANELYRINANNPIVISNIATSASTDYLWSSIVTYNNTQRIVVRLSDGNVSRRSVTTNGYYRCIWPAKSSDLLYGNKCNGEPGDACFVTDRMIADTHDRVALDYAAAVNECLASGGHLMDTKSFVNLVQQGLPNGTNNWNWINEAAYWYSNGYGLHLVKWSGIDTGWSGGSNKQAVSGSNNNRPFRCVYNKDLR